MKPAFGETLKKKKKTCLGAGSYGGALCAKSEGKGRDEKTAWESFKVVRGAVYQRRAGRGPARRREGAAGASARDSDTQGGGSELAAPGMRREQTPAAGRSGVPLVGN